ncbi:hypothetical protein HRbin30_00276 [bacterium HR30]|nr:hypothetical protein HRbin30_00276 [bacterium HR30]
MTFDGSEPKAFPVKGNVFDSFCQARARATEGPWPPPDVRFLLRHRISLRLLVSVSFGIWPFPVRRRVQGRAFFCLSIHPLVDPRPTAGGPPVTTDLTASVAGGYSLTFDTPKGKVTALWSEDSVEWQLTAFDRCTRIPHRDGRDVTPAIAAHVVLLTGPDRGPFYLLGQAAVAGVQPGRMPMRPREHCAVAERSPPATTGGTEPFAPRMARAKVCLAGWETRRYGSAP